ncbi:MAG: hypothetical protein EOM50_13035 [Erysipelotrichia bacterium]|nr:hypothetical protein [Erysipelotrichia bacterium]
MENSTILIELAKTIYDKKWCFKHCGHCMMCGSINVLDALYALPQKEVEEAFLSIDETMTDKSLEDIQKLFSYYESAGGFEHFQEFHWVPHLKLLHNTIDVKKIKENWQLKSQNRPNCSYTLLLDRIKLQEKLYPKKEKNKIPYGFDGRAKYEDSDDEIIIRQGWYER